ncbi:MAG: hypothetical protein AAF802_19630, partial [Planctomycetota bacterium]
MSVFRPTAARWLMTLILMFAAESAVQAQNVLARSQSELIVEAARSSVVQLSASLIPDVASSESELRDAISDLRQHLSRTADAENAEAWLAYLLVPELAESIEEKDANKQAKLAYQVTERATGLAPGLEVDEIARLRAAADRYGNAKRFARNEAVINALSSLLSRFAESLEDDQELLPKRRRSLIQVLDLLERAGQSVALQSQVATTFGRSNLHVMLSEDFISRGINRAVHQSSPVRDCILGTRIMGDALLTGHVTAGLEPSIGSVKVQLALQGSVQSSNLGYNGPVRLRTASNGQVYSTRGLEISESGVRFGPVQTSASLQTRINAIEHPLKIVRRIAKKKAAEQKPLSDRIAKRKLIQRISKSFDEQTADASSGPKLDLFSEARSVLRRLGLEEPTRSISSSEDSVHLHATVQGRGKLAADRLPPGVPSTLDIAVQVHCSVIDNSIGSLLAGRELSQSQLQSLLRRVSEPDGSGEDEDPFEVEFDEVRPITFDAEDGLLRLGVRGGRFARGSNVVKNIEVVASYRPVFKESGVIVLERVGELDIKFTGGGRPMANSARRGALKKSFADAFPPTILDQPLTIPMDAEMKALRGLSFKLTYFDAQDGWLTLGFDLQ